VRISKGTRNLFLFHNVYTHSRVHSASHAVSTGVLYWGYSNQRVKLITHIHLLRRSIMSGDMAVLPIYTFRVLIWTILPLPQLLMLLCQVQQKATKTPLGISLKRATLGLGLWSLFAFGQIRGRLETKHLSHAVMLLLLLLPSTSKSLSTVLMVCEIQTACPQALNLFT
jgi:hypothetical protein